MNHYQLLGLIIVLFALNRCVLKDNMKEEPCLNPICQSPLPAYVLFPEVKRTNQPPIFLLYTIKQRNVYIISERNIPLYGLFHVCERNSQLAGIEVDPASIPIYDGSYYPQTYNYSKKGDEIVIQKLDDPILDFKAGWKEYENLFNRNER